MSVNIAPNRLPPPSDPAATTLRVLLVEDNPVDRRIFGAMLTRLSNPRFDLSAADSLATGLARLAAEPFDLVLLDLGLPDSWDLETLRRVQTEVPRVPVIVVTGSDDEALAAEAVRAGAQDFLVKGQVTGSLLGRAIRYALTRHRAETALRESEEKYRELVENLNEVVYTLGSDAVISYVSPAVEHVGGYEPFEVIGHRFLDFVYPPDREPLLASFARTLAGQREPSEFRVVTKTGLLRWVRSSSHLIQVGDRILGLQGVLMDISDRKQAESEIARLNADLEQRVAERTAELTASNHELEAFCYSVSHDLRTPLRGIDGYCHALLEDRAGHLDAESRESLQRVRAAAQRMGHLIDDLLYLARLTRRAMRRAPVDLSALARQIAAELQALQPERAVRVVIADGVTATSDPRLMRVVLENLLGNAWKFTAGHATALIEFGTTTVGGERAYFVRDDGAGFDMRYVHKLFKPFQRLHGMGEFEGTGIGLAIVARIVQRHGGRVWAEGAVEQGAAFHFTL